MIKFVYCYRDEKANYWRAPYLDDHKPDEHQVLLQRSLSRLDDPKQIELAKDLVCYHIGTFDDESGEIKPIQPIKLFCTSDFLRGN